MRLAALALALAACTPTLEAEGDHHQYVISGVTMPRTRDAAIDFAVEIDGARANKIGAELAGFVPLGLTSTSAIDQGSLSLLLDVQARDLDSAAAAGVTIQDGALVAPAACSAPTACGRHLDGSGQFFAAGGAPSRFATIRGGTLDSEPAPLSLTLSADRTGSFQLPLLAARLRLTDLSEDGIRTGVIGGAIDQGVFLATVLPALHAAIDRVVAEDCQATPMPACQCAPGSAGQQIQVAFDTDLDCVITDPEFSSNRAIGPLRSPDVTVDGVPAISFGIAIQAAAATF